MESIIWRWACYFFGWEMNKKEKSWAICYASFKRVPKKVKGRAVNVICTIMIAFLLWFHSQSVLWGCCCWWYFQAVVKSVHVQVFRQRAHTMALLLLTSHLHLSLLVFLSWSILWLEWFIDAILSEEEKKGNEISLWKKTLFVVWWWFLWMWAEQQREIFIRILSL